MRVVRPLVFSAFSLLMLFSGTLSGADVAPPNPDSIQEVRARSGFEEHRYERISGSEDLCNIDYAELKYEQTGDNVLLHLGDQFIFADIGHAGYVDDTEPGCKLTVTNTVAPGQIVQKSVNVCKNPAQAFTSVQVLKQEKGHVAYSIHKRTGSKTVPSAQFTCVFRMVSP